jgi:hypothetical protein
MMRAMQLYMWLTRPTRYDSPLPLRSPETEGLGGETLGPWEEQIRNVAWLAQFYICALSGEHSEMITSMTRISFKPQARFDESRLALDRVLGAVQLSGVPVILLANKQVR